MTPATMPSCAASPARKLDDVFRDRRLRAESSFVGQRRRNDGTLAKTLRTVPSAPMKIMSSGTSVFFIQNATGASRVEDEDHAGVRRELRAIHQAVLALRFGARDLEREVCVRRVHDDGRQRRGHQKAKSYTRSSASSSIGSTSYQLRPDLSVTSSGTDNAMAFSMCSRTSAATRSSRVLRTSKISSS